MASIVVALGMLFRDMGTSAAIIQKETLSAGLLNAVFLLNMFVGFFVFVFLLATAPLFSSYFSQDKLLYVLIMLSITFPIMSLSTTQKALMERVSNFKKLAYIESISIIFSTLLCVLAAFLNFGVYSIVVQAICNAVISTLLILKASDWSIRQSKLKDFIYIKEIIGFSGNLIAFNTVNYLYRNADKYIIGKNMSTAVLGAYDLSYKIMLFPIQTLTSVLSRAFFPAFSKLQNNTEEFNQLFLKNTLVISLLCFPMLIELMALREDFVQLVFGSEWMLVSSLLLWLSPVGIIQALGSSTGSVLMAKGRTDILFKLGCLGAFLTVSGFFLAVYLNSDIVEFCQIYLISNIINFTIASYYVCGLIQYKLMKYFLINLPVLISGIMTYLFLEFLNDVLSQGLLTFIIKVIVGVLLFFSLFLVYSNIYINELLGGFLNKFLGRYLH